MNALSFFDWNIRPGIRADIIGVWPDETIIGALFDDVRRPARNPGNDKERSKHGLPGIPSLSNANAARGAPWIGAHNDKVFGEILGLSKERIEELKQAEAIK